MKFLAKLKKEGKIKIVEPSNEICQSYLEKSEKSLRSSNATLNIKCYEDSVSLAYYSMYYSILALFFKIGLKCENHTGSIILLKEIFDINNQTVLSAKKERVDKQYYVDFKIAEQEVKDQIKATELFNAIILDFIERLNNEKIINYRIKAEKILI